MAKAAIIIAAKIAASVAISAALQIAFAPHTHEDISGPRSTDLLINPSTYGIPIAWSRGTVRLSGNIIWSPGIIEHSTTTTTRVGGKKGSATTSTTNYTYTASFAVSFGEGPADQIIRIWADGKLIYDATQAVSGTGLDWQNINDEPAWPDAGGFSPGRVGYDTTPNNTIDTTAAASQGTVTATGVSFVFYKGSADQLPDPDIQNDKGHNNTPGFRNQVYVLFRDMLLTDYGERIPSITAEIAFNGVRQLFPKLGPMVTNIGGNLGTGPGFALDPTRPFVYFTTTSGTVIGRLNTLTNEVEATFPWSSYGAHFDLAGFPAITSYGDIVWGNINGGGFSTAYRIDPATFALLDGAGYDGTFGGHPNDIPNWGFPAVAKNAFGEYVAMVGNYTGAATCVILDVTPGRTMQVRNPSNVENDIIGNPIGDPDPLSVHTAFDPPGSGSNRRPVADKRGDIWFVGSSGSTVYLTRCHFVSAGSFSVLTTTLTPAWTWNNNAMYLPDQDAILLGCSGEVSALFDITSLSITQTGIAVPLTSGVDVSVASDGKFAQVNGGNLLIIDAKTLAIEQTIALADYGLSSVDSNFAQYDPQSGSVFLASGSELFRIFLNRNQAGVIGLDTVIGDLCDRAKLAPSQYDVNQLTVYNVHGFSVTETGDIRKAIETLCTAYRVDGVETDAKIRFVPRGAASIADIPEVDLGEGLNEDGSPVSLLAETDAQEQDLPYRVDVTFMDLDNSYQPGFQSSRRYQTPTINTVNSHRPQVLNFPLVLNAKEGKQLSEIQLYSQWHNRVSYEFSAMPRWMRLDPADVVRVFCRGKIYRIRLMKNDIGYGIVPGGVLEDDGSYRSFSSSDSGIIIPPPAITPLLQTGLAMMDMNLAQDVDADDASTGPYYGFTYPSLAAFRGAALFRSTNNSIFDQVASSNKVLTYGTVVAAPGAPVSPFSWDYINTLDVLLPWGNLFNDTEPNVLNGSNFAYIGSRLGFGEFIQFTTVEQLATNKYRLSGLLRGRRGTEWACAGHVAGEFFVMMADASKIHEAITEINLQRWWKAVTFGLTPESASSNSFTTTGNDLKPYAPVEIRGITDSNGNITITWFRRTRYNGPWADGTGTVPLNEQSELYDMEVMNGSAVVRTVTNLTTATAVYTRAWQLADFGATPPATFTVKIYQKSATLGRGFPGTGVVPSFGGLIAPATFPAGGNFYINGN